MSPAERATAAELARLAAEIERDQEAMARCSADAELSAFRAFLDRARAGLGP